MSFKRTRWTTAKKERKKETGKKKGGGGGGMDNQLWTQRDLSSDYCNLVHEWWILFFFFLIFCFPLSFCSCRFVTWGVNTGYESTVFFLLYIHHHLLLFRFQIQISRQISSVPCWFPSNPRNNEHHRELGTSCNGGKDMDEINGQ